MLALQSSNGVSLRRAMAKTLSPDDAEARVLGRAFKNLRQKAGLTQAQAAQNYGVTPQAWQRYEAGARNHKFEQLEPMATAIGATYDDLMAERAQLLGQPAPAGNNVHALPGMVPVYGFAAGAGERIALAAGSELRFVPMHPAQIGYKRPGVAEVVGESMYPRYKPRELAYFVFDLRPARGDDAIVELKDGTAIIKEYAGERDGQIWLKEFSPEERTFGVQTDTVKSIHAVVR